MQFRNWIYMNKTYKNAFKGQSNYTINKIILSKTNIKRMLKKKIRLITLNKTKIIKILMRLQMPIRII
jgi:hypothetical protein